MVEETTTEQLAEIDRDMADIERQVAELVEEAQQPDYPQPEPIQVREGRWQMRGGHHVSVAPMAGDDFDSIAYGYTWRGIDWPDLQWNNNGVHLIDSGARSKWDLVTYLGPIEPQPQPQPEPESDTELQAQVAFLKGREVTLGTRLQQEREVTTRLRHELKTVQNQLAAVKAELASVAADRQRLQIELDAAQQVPADSPELRQLRADLEQMTLGRDTYRDGYERVLSDLKTIRETAKAEAVEAIAEWLQAFRGCNSPSLASLLLEALPSIMRSLTGLNDEEIE